MTSSSRVKPPAGCRWSYRSFGSTQKRQALQARLAIVARSPGWSRKRSLRRRKALSAYSICFESNGIEWLWTPKHSPSIAKHRAPEARRAKGRPFWGLKHHGGHGAVNAPERVPTAHLLNTCLLPLTALRAVNCTCSRTPTSSQKEHAASTKSSKPLPRHFHSRLH